MAETYDPDLVSVIVDVAPITGFSGGTPITAARRVDETTLTKGMRDAGGWSLNKDSSGTITLVLLGSHPDNDILAALHLTRREFPVLLKDNGGSTLAFSRSSRFVKMPDKVMGAVETQDVTWTIVCDKLELFTGGN